MKRLWKLLGILATILCLCCLSGCDPEPEFQSVKHVGTVPANIQRMIDQGTFTNVTADGGRLLKPTVETLDEENRIVRHQVQMMDLYGQELASYACTSDDAYHVTTLTATDDGGFLFVLGFSDYAYDQNTWASDKGFASHVIKCDQHGHLQFDIPFEDVEGYALEYCFEKNGLFYLFGTRDTPETRKRGISSPSDIHVVMLDQSGSMLKSKTIAGTDYDSLNAAEISGDDFVLSLYTQSTDGDFAGSTERYRVFTVDSQLEIIDQQDTTGRSVSDYKIGELNGEAVYRNDERFTIFYAGTPQTLIDYGDFYLIISENPTGIYPAPIAVSSIWYYTEAVYSAYDQQGRLLFRTAVDSTPDYEAALN